MKTQTVKTVKTAKITVKSEVTEIVTTKVKRERKPKTKNTNGFIIYDGKSQFDGSDIIVIVTNSREAKLVKKIGLSYQTWIIKKNIHPLDAMRSRQDLGVCWNCPFKNVFNEDTQTLQGVCYVNLSGLSSVYASYVAGQYNTEENYSLGLNARIGSYGDPAAVPIEVWERLLSQVPSSTGYTRQWKNPKYAAYKAFCMASCHNMTEYQQAVDMGWKAYIVRGEGEDLPQGAIECPQPSDPVRIHCHSCGLCDAKTGSVAAIVHGGGKKYYNN